MGEADPPEERWQERMAELIRTNPYFNPQVVYDEWDHLRTLAEKQPTPPVLSPKSELWSRLDAVLLEEERRARWQGSGWAIALGLAIIILFLGAVGLGIWFSSGQPPISWLGISSLAWVWGTIGGASIGLYDFVHDWFTLTIEAYYGFWTLTKPLTGGVMGAVTVALVHSGVVSLAVGGKATVLSGYPTLLIVLAFAAGFKEQWFFAWLAQVKPATKAKTPSVK